MGGKQRRTSPQQETKWDLLTLANRPRIGSTAHLTFAGRPDGRHVAYRMNETRLADESAVDVLSQNGSDRLTLVTRGPFDALREPSKSTVAVQ